MEKIPEKYDQPQIYTKTYEIVTSIHKSEHKNGGRVPIWWLGEHLGHPTPSGSNPNANLEKSGEDHGEEMEEKRGREG